MVDSGTQITVECFIEKCTPDCQQHYGEFKSHQRSKWQIAYGNSITHPANYFRGNCSLPLFMEGTPEIKDNETWQLLYRQLVEWMNRKQLCGHKGVDLNFVGNRVDKSKKLVLAEMQSVDSYTN